MNETEAKISLVIIILLGIGFVIVSTGLMGGVSTMFELTQDCNDICLRIKILNLTYEESKDSCIWYNKPMTESTYKCCKEIGVWNSGFGGGGPECIQVRGWLE